MSRLQWVFAVAALLSPGSTPVFAQVPAGAEQRTELRAEIGAGRDAAEALYRQQVEECRTRFIVSSCVEAASKQRHDTLKRLDSQRTALDDAEREERAAERREAIAKKQADEESQRLEAQARERAAEAQRAAAHTHAAAPVARETPAHTGKEPPSPEERAAREASARAAYALKQLQAEARRQEAARRNAEHASKTKPAAPLPVPGDVVPLPHGASQPLSAQPASAASAP